jgi:hypothetical protein
MPNKPLQASALRLVLLMLFALHGHALAGWVKVYEDEALSYYADPSTVRRTSLDADHEGNVMILDLTDYQQPKIVPGLQPYLSILTQSEFDCRLGRMRWLFAAFHLGNMGSGSLLQMAANADTEERWEIIAPNSLGEVRMRFACLPWATDLSAETAAL